MSDEHDDNADNNEEVSPSGIDHMAEMAAAMEADGIPIEDMPSDAESISVSNNEEASPSGIDHMAEMAAAMEADGIPIEDMPSDAESIARSVSNKDVNIDTLLKVPVSLAIEVGRTKMVLSDLLETQEGTVIELDRLLDDPLDILVNGALIAHGVVVLENESFGIQITDIISLQERARSL